VKMWVTGRVREEFLEPGATSATVVERTCKVG
jgi:hypothetical protein